MGEHEACHEIEDFTINNELTSETMHRLASDLLDVKPPRTGGQFVYYELTNREPASNVARTIEASCFEEFFKETPQELRHLYGPYENQSTFFIAIDTKEKMPIGALRVIANGDNGLLTLNDMSSPESHEKGVGEVDLNTIKQYHDIESLNDCWDIGTVAVLPDYRGRKRVSVMLYRAMYNKAERQDIKHLVSVIDKHPYEGSIKPLHIPFKPLAGLDAPFRYYGSRQSYAVYGRLAEFKESMTKYYNTLAGRTVNLFAEGALARLIVGKRDDEIQLR